ncbi:minor tail protein [Streptomyces phage Targaryen]|nr:minor tail protein [Streptomyces phage Targaryen]
MAITFAKPRLMRFNNNAVTDHNRGELSIDVERIEKKQRMADGTMRKYIVADKRTFGVSWQNLPHSSSYTVDGFWGARQLKSFFDATPGAFTLELTYGDGTVETYQVMFSDFNMNLTKRGRFDFYEVTLSMEQV